MPGPDYSTSFQGGRDRAISTNHIGHGSHEYSQEELVAEMGAAFLAAEAGIDAEGLVDNSAAYISSWVQALRSDAKLVIFACGASGASPAVTPAPQPVPPTPVAPSNLPRRSVST